MESDVDCGRGCGWGFGSDVYVAGDWPDDRQVWCAGGVDGEHRRFVYLDVRVGVVGCESEGDGCDDSVGVLRRLWDRACDIASPVQIGTSVVVSRWFIRMRGRTNGILGFVALCGDGAVPVDRVDCDCAEWLARCLVCVERGCVRSGAFTGGVADIGATGRIWGCGRMVTLQMTSTRKWKVTRFDLRRRKSRIGPQQL